MIDNSELLLASIMQECPSSSYKNRKGYVSKQLAALSNQAPSFRRNKNGIKKENKQICREARQKKNIYVHQLEKIKSEQEQEIAGLKMQVQALQGELEEAKLIKDSQHRNHHQNSGVSQLITEYKELLRGLSLKDDILIKRSLAVLRSRFGIAGRDRTKWMQEHLLRLVELAMPMHFRLLLENSDNSKAFFELLGAGAHMKACRVAFNQDQKAILKQMKPKIKKTKQVYNKTLMKLVEVWSELRQHGEQSQKIIDQIEEKVNHPVFVGNLLMTLDGERSRNASIYPLNYFQELFRQTKAEEQEFQYNPFEEEEDRPAFDFYFNDFN